LARGFALVRDRNGRPLRTATAVAIGARIDIEFSDGRVGARADSVQTLAGSHVERPRRRRRQLVDPGQGDLF
jgi:exodeoxyribonuclease VII large subunit